MRSRRHSCLTLPTMAAAIALAGCNRLAPNGESGTMSLLRAGSERVCVAEDVHRSLRDLIMPKATELGINSPPDDRAAALSAVTITYDMTTLQEFDKAVAKATCNTSVNLGNGQGESRTFNIMYQVTPSADTAATFIVTTQVNDAKEYAAGLAGGLLAQAGRVRQNEEDEQRLEAGKAKLLATVTSKWLLGTWIPTSASASACGYGEAMSFQANQVYEGLLSTGRWSLTGDQLHRVGSGAQGSSDETDTITEADAISFTLTKSDGSSASYRRCTHHETTTIDPPPASDAETTQ